MRCKNARRAPVGAVLAGASLEELSAVTLEGLLVLQPGTLRQPVHALKLELTVVKKAFLVFGVHAVVADNSGKHVAIAVYNTGARTASDAQKLLPVGARIILKQPFLKRCSDAWLGLMVDEPATIVRCDIPLIGSILVLGDGDFSFSRALQELKFRGEGTGAAHITATSLDSKSEVENKYQKAAANLKALSFSDVTVLHGVDATRLEQTLRCNGEQAQQHSVSYDTVVWNFPYPKGERVADSRLGADLLTDFFHSVKPLLRPDAEIRIVLASSQGGSTREAAGTRPAWKVEGVAAAAGFDLIEVFPFDPEMFPGYEPRREFKDEPFPYKESRVHLFRCRSLTEPSTSVPNNSSNTSAPPEQSQRGFVSPGSESFSSAATGIGSRHMASAFGSLFHSNELARERGTSGQGEKPLCVDDFRQFACSSAVARAVVEAGEAFDQAVETLAGLRESEQTLAQGVEELWCYLLKENAALTETLAAPRSLRALLLLNQCYASEYGRQVAHWPDMQILRRAVGCTYLVARAAMMHSCSFSSSSNHTASGEVIAFKRSLVEDDFDAVEEMAAKFQFAAPGAGEHMNVGARGALLISAQGASLLAASLFVRSNIISQLSGPESKYLALEPLDLAISMGLSSPDVFRLRGTLGAFVFNRLQDSGEDDEASAALQRMLEDCTAALELKPDDNMALWFKAYALRSASPCTRTNVAAALDAYEKYIERTEVDAKCRPAAHYHAGLLAVSVPIMDSQHKKGTNFEMEKAVAWERGLQHYRKGIAAEARRLPCFPPVGSLPSKDLLSMCMQVHRKKQS